MLQRTARPHPSQSQVDASDHSLTSPPHASARAPQHARSATARTPHGKGNGHVHVHVWHARKQIRRARSTSLRSSPAASFEQLCRRLGCSRHDRPASAAPAFPPFSSRRYLSAVGTQNLKPTASVVETTHLHRRCPSPQGRQRQHLRTARWPRTPHRQVVLTGRSQERGEGGGIHTGGFTRLSSTRAYSQRKGHQCRRGSRWQAGRRGRIPPPALSVASRARLRHLPPTLQ